MFAKLPVYGCLVYKGLSVLPEIFTHLRFFPYSNSMSSVFPSPKKGHGKVSRKVAL